MWKYDLYFIIGLKKNQKQNLVLKKKFKNFGGVAHTDMKIHVCVSHTTKIIHQFLKQQ